LARYAEQEGLTLADVFTDRQEAGTAERLERTAFIVMMDSLRRPGVAGVLTPSLSHFSRFPGVHKAIRTLIELEIGARVFVMDCPQEDRHDADATPAVPNK
jgi:hypothetical protein